MMSSKKCTVSTSALLSILALSALLVPLTANAGAKLAYIPNLEVSLPAKKDIHSIDIYRVGEKNTRPSAVLGSAVVESDGGQNIEQLVDAARAKAAEIGADFIGIAKITTRSKIHTDPSFAFAVPFLHGAMAIGHSGSTERQEIPAMLVVIGAYSRSTVGIRWDQDAVKQGKYIIRDLDSYSPGLVAGLSIGDEVLEINGMNPGDKRVKQFQLEAAPGTKVRLHVRRGDQRLDVEMETVAPP
jgi:hypothetical protein